jgi:putative heme-binding domain-containing protein
MKIGRITVSVALACLASFSWAHADDDLQAQQDATIVETLLRLENFDLDSSAKGKAAVERYLKRERGSDQYFDLIEKFAIKSAGNDLIALAVEKSGDTTGVRAVRLLFNSGQGELLTAAISDQDAGQVAALIKTIGLANDKRAEAMLAPLVTDAKRSLAVRSAAARAVGRSVSGQKMLLGLVVDGKLPADLKFTAADILHSARDKEIQSEAAKHLRLPATAGESSLPPLSKLIGRHGNAANGQQIFLTKGTCAKCHPVGSQGKNIGPALTEIGSKLAKEAMYVAILDPSAGISHNYESYLVATVDGITSTGLMVNETDEAITLRTAEGIDQTFKREDVDELVKLILSIMPSDLQKLMTTDELVDLVEYLQSLKKK